MTDRDKTISPAGSLPGSPAGGPLCRRMIEDMTVRGFAPRTQTGYIRAVRDITAFSAALRTRRARRKCGVSAAHEIPRGLGHEHEHSRLGLALLLHADAGPGRYARSDDDGSRAAQAAAGAQPRGGRTSSRCGPKLKPSGLKYRAALSPQRGVTIARRSTMG